MCGRGSYVTQEGLEKIKSGLEEISNELKGTVVTKYRKTLKWQERAIKNASKSD